MYQGNACTSRVQPQRCSDVQSVCVRARWLPVRMASDLYVSGISGVNDAGDRQIDHLQKVRRKSKSQSNPDTWVYTGRCKQLYVRRAWLYRPEQGS